MCVGKLQLLQLGLKELGVGTLTNTNALATVGIASAAFICAPLFPLRADGASSSAPGALGGIPADAGALREDAATIARATGTAAGCSIATAEENSDLCCN